MHGSRRLVVLAIDRGAGCPCAHRTAARRRSLTRIVAADWLGHIGPNATAAVPSLLVLATEDSVQHASTTAAAALRRIDLAAARRVMNHYIPLLNAADIQGHGERPLPSSGSLGPWPSRLFPRSSPLCATRMNWSAGMCSPRPGKYLGFLPVKFPMPYLRVYATPSALVRQAAATQFAFAVPLPPGRLDEITAMLEQQDAAVSGLLRSALEKARQADAARVETFVLMIGQSTGREYALHQLARLGPMAIAAAPVLITVLQDERPLHRYLAVEALSAIGAGGGQTIVALTPLLHDPDPIVRESATEALAAIDSRSPALHNGAGESPRMKP